MMVSRVLVVAAVLAAGVTTTLMAQPNPNQRPQVGKETKKMSQQKQQIVDLLKSIETGDPKPAAVINPQTRKRG